MFEKLDKEKIKEQLCAPGCDIPGLILYDITDSTNLRAREWAKAHPENRTPMVFIAEGQTAGRGRLGKSFHSAEGAGIYITFLLYPDTLGFDATAVTAYSAVKLARAIECVSSVKPEIKWVNDLYACGRKIAGILAEGIMNSDGSISCLILGMGINVYKTPLPEEISTIAASIEDITGEKINRSIFTAEIIRQILSEIYAPDTDEIYEEYKGRSILPGKTVTVIKAGESYTASVLDISRDYSLLIERDGKTERLFTGEVSTRLDS